LIAGTGLGYVELLYVQTLQYTGFWIESICSVGQALASIHSLLEAAVELVCGIGVTQKADLIGHLALPEDGSVYQAFMGRQFAKIGEYRPWIGA
jgi:hypothetical protein